VRDEEQKTYILSVTEVQPVMVKPWATTTHLPMK
jgi:hypothetical protein